MLKVIKNNKMKAVIDPMGGYVTEFKLDDSPVFFPKKEIEVNGNKKLRGGNHVCLPHFGDSSKIGQSNHGFARDSKWGILDEADNFVVLVLQENVQSYENMEVRLEYKLEDNKFITRLEVENKGQESFNISPAFHPYFYFEDKESIKLDGKKLTINQEINDSLFRNRVDYLEIDGKKYSLETLNMDKFIVWTDELDNYICVEPSYNHAALRDGTELVEVKPGQLVNFEFTIGI